MEETQQFNMRVSKFLLDDLMFIERMTNVSKTNWMKYKIAELIRIEKSGLLRALNVEYVQNRRSDEEYKQLTGRLPDELLKKNRLAYHKRMVKMTKCTTNREFAKKALLEKTIDW